MLECAGIHSCMAYKSCLHDDNSRVALKSQSTNSPVLRPGLTVGLQMIQRHTHKRPTPHLNYSYSSCVVLIMHEMHKTKCTSTWVEVHRHCHKAAPDHSAGLCLHFSTWLRSVGMSLQACLHL